MYPIEQSATRLVYQQILEGGRVEPVYLPHFAPTGFSLIFTIMTINLIANVPLNISREGVIQIVCVAFAAVITGVYAWVQYRKWHKNNHFKWAATFDLQLGEVIVEQTKYIAKYPLKEICDVQTLPYVKGIGQNVFRIILTIRGRGRVHVYECSSLREAETVTEQILDFIKGHISNCG
jgi:hypothetical protein